MADAVVDIAVLGLNEGGRLLLEAASRLGRFRVCAIAGQDTSLLERLATQYNCQAYDDYRQLVVQNELDCLLVAAPMHSCDEYVRTAMKRRYNVLKTPPPARNFEEAAELVRLAESEKVHFAVANLRRFSPSFLAMREALQSGGIENVFLIEAYCWVGDEPVTPWQSDPKLAGGGVLLHKCYEVIDQLMWNFALPQHVYSLKVSQAHDKQQRLYLTEDTAVVTMKFSDTLIANIVASRRRGTGTSRRFIRLYGREKTLTIDDVSMTVGSTSEDDTDKTVHGGDLSSCAEKMLDSFALSILSPDENKLHSSGRENLRDMAVIEAAYLSARTSMPEEPQRILQMAQFGSDDI